ncbi:MAG: 3'-5' exonuclease, partial [bacterium]|nr:3'-5' exonuclease [bacterium]
LSAGRTQGEGGAQELEKQDIQTLIQDLKLRGYEYSDIAILAYKNKTVIQVSSWLNEKGVPFISYSNLDIRQRKIIGELIGFLKFLDSPVDDLSFATFILGDIFKKILEQENSALQPGQLHSFIFQTKQTKSRPIYKAFQAEHPTLWDTYFSSLFKSVGYRPLYDLVTEIYRTFSLYTTFPQEEATLTKLLEVIQAFEGHGKNNLREFLKFSMEEDSEDTSWNINVPAGINAVRIMSIHKAKGLGFPAVILLLYGEGPPKPLGYVIKEEADSVTLLKLTKDDIKGVSELEDRYNSARNDDWVNRLNTLYVGMTRAKAELYVIGVTNKAGTYPINLLPAMEYPPLNEKPKEISSDKKKEAKNAELSRAEHTRPVQENLITRLEYEQKKRGELIHQILARIEYLDDTFPQELTEIIRAIQLETGEEIDELEMKKTLGEFLAISEIRPYFVAQPTRIILREQELVNRTGNLYRFDRIIVDADRVTILDFKTGGQEKEVEYIAQMNQYLKLGTELYPQKSVQGIIGYIDLKKCVSGIS